MSNRVCQDSSRQFVYDTLSSYFLRDEPFAAGTCKLCGTTGIEVNKDGRCRAQAALTQKRHTAAEGHPIAYGSPLKDADRRGYYSMIDTFAALLIHDEGAIFTGKVVPSMPLPASVEIRADLRFEDLLHDLAHHPRNGAVIAVFNKKGDIELRRSTRETIHINGGASPVALDRRTLMHAITLVETHGVAAIRDALRIKRMLVQAPSKVRDAHTKLRKFAPDLADSLKSIPNGGAEIQHAIAIVRHRTRKSEHQSQQ